MRRCRGGRSSPSSGCCFGVGRSGRPPPRSAATTRNRSNARRRAARRRPSPAAICSCRPPMRWCGRPRRRRTPKACRRSRSATRGACTPIASAPRPAGAFLNIAQDGGAHFVKVALRDIPPVNRGQAGIREGRVRRSGGPVPEHRDARRLLPGPRAYRSRHDGRSRGGRRAGCAAAPAPAAGLGRRPRVEPQRDGRRRLQPVHHALPDAPHPAGTAARRSCRTWRSPSSSTNDGAYLTLRNDGVGPGRLDAVRVHYKGRTATLDPYDFYLANAQRTATGWPRGRSGDAGTAAAGEQRPSMMLGVVQQHRWPRGAGVRCSRCSRSPTFRRRGWSR